MAEPRIERVEVTLGEATESAATLYVRPVLASGAAIDPSWRLTGTLRGPRCRYAQTLASEFALRDLGREPRWLAAAAIVEPCYWSPDLPFLYDLEVTIDDGDRVIARHATTTGLQRLAPRGSSLFFNGRRFVLRAWAPPEITPELFDAARDEGLALWSDAGIVESELLAEASARGVLLVTRDERGTAWPARVGIDAAWVTPFEELPDAIANALNRPIIVRRPEPSIRNATEARAAVERLQRDCAPHTDLAGYVVGAP